MTTQNEDQDPVQTDWLDPFPEPHTIPSGWDFSGIFPSPQADSAIDVDSPSEVED